MLGLYCSCVSIVNSDEIPPDEIAFYIFALVRYWSESVSSRITNNQAKKIVSPCTLLYRQLFRKVCVCPMDYNL